MMPGEPARAETPSHTPVQEPPMSEATSPTDKPPLHYSGLLEVADRIAAGELSPVELTRHTLDRIAAVDGRLHGFATVMGEQALAVAREAEQEIAAGSYRGPLHGVPVAVKDLCETQGVRTMSGHSFLRDFVPDEDCTVVKKLTRAGAVLVGKLNLTEGAMGGYHRDFEVPVNPWHESLWTGASSSGSGVAAAAGLSYATLGSDTGGSIRFPAMANGCVGLKPTYGRVSRHGVRPLAETLDHVGPLTRRVADAAVTLEAIAGPDPADPTSLAELLPDMRAALEGGVRGLRIGWDRAFATTGVDAGLVGAIEGVLGELEGLGAEIVELRMPAFGEAEVDAWFSICGREAFQVNADRFPARADEYGNYFREFLELGMSVSEAGYAAAAEVRAAYNALFRAALSSVDAVVAPAGGAPFEIAKEVYYAGLADFAPVMANVNFAFTAPADFAGTPSVTVPCGVADKGVPYTVQFLGDRLSEPMLCRIAHTYEEATDWHLRHPDL
jgi:amidase